MPTLEDIRHKHLADGFALVTAFELESMSTLKDIHHSLGTLLSLWSFITPTSNIVTTACSLCDLGRTNT
jgi:hypothetical protein